MDQSQEKLHKKNLAQRAQQKLNTLDNLQSSAGMSAYHFDFWNQCIVRDTPKQHMTKRERKRLRRFYSV